MDLTEAKKEMERFVKLKTTMRPTFVDVLLQAQEAKHGTWQRGRKKYWNFRCSECGIETPWDSPFCPQCGAQMEKMDPDEDKEKARARARAQRSSEDVLEEIRI